MEITLTLNGESRTCEAAPLEPLLDVLRVQCGLTGTKYGCGEGECGACTVLLNGETVMSCLVPAIQAAGGTIETVEGLAAPGPEGEVVLSALQQAFIEEGAAQCGICTPGMLVAAAAYVRNPAIAPGGVPEALAGNLCRCTGYARIFAAVEKARRGEGADEE